MQVHALPSWTSTVIPIITFGALMAWRFRRMQQVRRLKIETLWVAPAIFIVIVGLTFASTPPGPAGWGWSALALLAGGGIGWYRGSTMRISVDPETHALSQQASPASMLFLAALVALKMGSRAEFGGGYQPGQHGVSLATDIGLAFALGLIVATRLEMSIRARRLLAAARGGI